jgi:hypothetical protein
MLRDNLAPLAPERALPPAGAQSDLTDEINHRRLPLETVPLPVLQNRRQGSERYRVHDEGQITFTQNEVSAYYTARVPNLKGGRGPCPVHKGTGPNFAVNLETGEAFCHSRCECGWDMIALEMALAGSDFKAAKTAVFRLVGRSEPSNGNNGRSKHSVISNCASSWNVVSWNHETTSDIRH